MLGKLPIILLGLPKEEKVFNLFEDVFIFGKTVSQWPLCIFALSILSLINCIVEYDYYHEGVTTPHNTHKYAYENHYSIAEIKHQRRLSLDVWAAIKWCIGPHFSKGALNGDLSRFSLEPCPIVPRRDTLAPCT